MNIAEIWTAIDAGQLTDAERLLREDSELFASRAGQMAYGYLLSHTGRFDEAREVYTNLRAQHAGEEWEHVAAHQQGVVERQAGQPAQALTFFQQELDLIRQLGDRPHKLSVNAYQLGETTLELGQLETARAHFQDSLHHARRQDDPVAVACAERGLGDLSVREGLTEDARAHYERALAAYQEAEDDVDIQEIRDLLQGLRPHQA